MRALTIQQPYAWLIIHGQKSIENRRWKTAYRGPFLVHAAKKPANFQQICETIKREFDILLPESFDFGGIIGRADLTDCVTMHDSPWFSGPYGFVLRHPQPLQFRPLRGQLGFFHI